MTETCRYCNGTGKQLSGWAGTPTSRDCLACATLPPNDAAVTAGEQYGLEYRKTATIRAKQWWKMGDHPAVEIKTDVFAPVGVPVAIIRTLEGPLAVSPGDWIATGVEGEHWAIKPDIFTKSYEAVGVEFTPRHAPGPSFMANRVLNDGPFIDRAERYSDKSEAEHRRGAKRDDYRGWLVEFDNPPIPCRDFDWSAVHPDFAGGGDNRQVWGKSWDAVRAAIDEWHEENRS